MEIYLSCNKEKYPGMYLYLIHILRWSKGFHFYRIM